MKIFYKVHYPADGDAIHDGRLELADDTGDTLILNALESEIESEEIVDSGEQIRVYAWRNDETEPFITHTWDHS